MLLPCLFLSSLSQILTYQVLQDHIAQHMLNVSAGDHIRVTFDSPGGWAFLSRPSQYTTHVAQSCSDPCSSSCIFYHETRPGIFGLGPSRGFIDFYIVSTSRVILRAGYTGIERDVFSKETCADIFVSKGPSMRWGVLNWGLIVTSCLFVGDVDGIIYGSTALTARMLSNDGFAVTYGGLIPRGGTNGVLVANTPAANGSLGGNLTFTAPSGEEYGNGWFLWSLDASSTPVVWGDNGRSDLKENIIGDFKFAECTPSSDPGTGTSVWLIVGIAAGAVALVACIIVFCIVRRSRAKVSSAPENVKDLSLYGEHDAPRV